MGKSLSDAVLDGSLAVFVGDQISVCSAEPTTYAEATSTFKLAISTGVVAGDFVIANGDTNGRKSTVAQQSAVTIDATGTATHVAITNLAGTLLKAVTTNTSQLLTSGGTVDIGTFKLEIADPT
tara:strand:- start:36359 stop:36730 length:372 start_codon:yes stop_codon:yes gene_type:complete